MWTGVTKEFAGIKFSGSTKKLGKQRKTNLNKKKTRK